MKAGLVWRIWEALRLEAETIALSVDSTAWANQRPVQIVAGVELQPGCVGQDLENAACRRLQSPCRGGEHTGGWRTQHPVMVIAVTANDLLVGYPNAGADRRPMGKVEGSPANGPNFSSRNHYGIDWREIIGLNRDHMVEDITSALARQVEITVVGQINDCRPVGRRRIVDAQFVGRANSVGYLHGEVPGIALIAVGAQMAQDQRLAVAGVSLLDHLMKSLWAAVHGVRAGIGLEPVFDAIEREPASRDAVGVAAGQRAEMWTAVGVAGKRVET